MRNYEAVIIGFLYYRTSITFTSDTLLQSELKLTFIVHLKFTYIHGYDILIWHLRKWNNKCII